MGLSKILGSNDNIVNKNGSSNTGGSKKSSFFSLNSKRNTDAAGIVPDFTSIKAPRTIYKNANFSISGKYEIIQVLGKGSYGVVCSAKHKLPNEDQEQFTVAIKKITNIFYREILLKRAIREIKFMNYFKGHKHIVNLIDIEIVQDKPYDGLYCYQELIDYDLARVIHSSVQLSEFHIQHFIYQILCGVKYIHSADVIHRDLKPGNILCTVNGCLKICDFGLARGVAKQFVNKNSKPNEITNYVATRWYRAPELILSNNEYTKSVDMWSVGCILAEFYGRRPIFMGKDSIHQVYEITKILGTPSRSLLVKYGTLKAWNLFGHNSNHNLDNLKSGMPWSTVYPMASATALDLIDKLLQWEPESRLNVLQSLEHQFVQSVRKPNDEPICSKGPFNFSYEYNLNSMEDLRQCLNEEVAQFYIERQLGEEYSKYIEE